MSALEQPLVRLLVEVLLRFQRPLDSLVDEGGGRELVVPQVRVRRVQPINTAGRLLGDLPGVVQRVHDHRIGGHAVPAFRARRVLDEVEPSIRRRYRIVTVTVVLRDGKSGTRLG